MSERETRTPHGASLRTCPFCGGEATAFADAWPHAIYCPECLAMVKSLRYGDEGKEDAARKWNRRATGKRDAKGEMIYAGDELGMRSTGKRGTVFYNAEDAAFEVDCGNVVLGLDAESDEYEVIRDD